MIRNNPCEGQNSTSLLYTGGVRVYKDSNGDNAVGDNIYESVYFFI